MFPFFVLGLPSSKQKLLHKGQLNDGQSLRDAKITNGCKITLIGSTPTLEDDANMAAKSKLDLRQTEAQSEEYLLIF